MLSIPSKPQSACWVGFSRRITSQQHFPTWRPLSDDDKGTPGEDLYLEKAADLADRLLGAFDSGQRCTLCQRES